MALMCKLTKDYLNTIQGQEVVAENALALAAKEGHWVILQV